MDRAAETNFTRLIYRRDEVIVKLESGEIAWMGKATASRQKASLHHDVVEAGRLMTRAIAVPCRNGHARHDRGRHLHR